MSPEMLIRPLQPRDVMGCERILRGLPEWFGVEQATAQYVRDLESLPGLVAIQGGRVLGFLALRPHNTAASEIHVLAVHRDHHRSGIGRALFQRAETGKTSRAW
jgi:ribosomal protein S18 acetylase RimI-like enzyme